MVHDPAGPKSLIDAFAAALRGEDPTIPDTVPPHLQGVEWKFLCECGTTWRAKADATICRGKVHPPIQRCVGCPGWVTGRLEAFRS